VLIDLAAREGLVVEERPFSVAEALAAREAFITAATTLVMPVVVIDGKAVGSGRPGSFATALRRLFHSQAQIAPAWSSNRPAKSDK
jgi:D-alanine transaminase